MQKVPFIHLFSCSTGLYLYDVNTDTILKVEKETYNCLKSKHNIENNEQILKLKRAGYLKSKHVQISEHPATQFLFNFYMNNLGSLTLQVTQNCNLRCDYCVYSGKYNTRTHNAKKMSFDLAKKGIDYIISHSGNCNELKIGFYGGEPLLEFDLIKNCVEYANIQAKGKQIEYLITTNGVLLKKDIINFLVHNKFTLTISFDGPKEIHDKYRKFSNGEGSFDIVMKNVKYLRKKYYNYFKERVSFSTVINPENGFKCLADYLNEERIFKEATINAALVSDAGVKEKSKASEEFREEYNYEYFKLLMEKLGKIKKGNASVIVQEYFEYLNFERGGKQTQKELELPDKSHHGGPCIPGERSIFLNVDGDIYPCERVCENAEISKMGDIENGIDIEKALRILNIEKITQQECQQCWAYRYCNFCIRYAEISTIDEIAIFKNNILSRCETMRQSTENIFKDYCVMRELGYDFETKSIKKGRG